MDTFYVPVCALFRGFTVVLPHNRFNFPMLLHMRVCARHDCCVLSWHILLTSIYSRRVVVRAHIYYSFLSLCALHVWGESHKARRQFQVSQFYTAIVVGISNNCLNKVCIKFRHILCA